MSAPSLPVPASRQRFRRALLAWYRAHGRDLPWRRTSDPYHILVSEMMLQQTQVDRVVPKYHEWLDKYPSLGALAAARAQEVNKDVAAARVQHPAAPSSRDRPRVGPPATAAAFRPTRRRCFLSRVLARTRQAQFGASHSDSGRRLSIPMSARVLFRVFVARGDARAHAMRRHLWDVSEVLVPRKHVFDFNQALMDLGATVCAARKPKCPACPLAGMCRSYPSLGRA